MKMIFKSINVYNYYKYLSGLLLLIALTIFSLNAIGIGHDFFNGLASSFLVLGIVLRVILFIKRKDIDFKDDLNQMGKDERLQKRYIKNHAILNHVSLGLIIILVTVSVFYEFPFQLGGSLILWVQIILGFILFVKKEKRA